MSKNRTVSVRPRRVRTLRASVAALVTTAACAGLASSAAAATYYVSPTGSDSASGLAPSTALRSLRVGVARLHAGDTLLLDASAAFHASLVLNGIAGTATAPVTIGAYGGARAVIDLAATPTAGAISVGSASRYVTVRDLEVRNAGTALYIADSSHLTFAGLNIHDVASGLHNGGAVSTYGVISGSVIHGRPGNASSGIGLFNAGSIGWRVVATDIGGWGDSCVIDIAGRSTYDGDHIHGCGTDAAITYGKHGVYAKGPAITVSNSEVDTVTASGPGAGSCISPRQGGALVNDLLHGCHTGIGWYDNLTAGVAATLTITGTRVYDVVDSALFADTARTAGASIAFDLSGDTFDGRPGPTYAMAGGSATSGPNALSVHRPNAGTTRFSLATSLVEDAPAAGGWLVVMGSAGGAGQIDYQGRTNTFIQGVAGTGLVVPERFLSPGVGSPYGLAQWNAAKDEVGSN